MFSSNMRTAILGAIAFSATFSAVQLASGHDLTSGLRALSASWESGVNRADKADRIASAHAGAGRTRTISIQLRQLANTSIVVRIPRPQPVDSAEPAKTPIACEPVVSVLTDIAKRLQPGRCIT